MQCRIADVTSPRRAVPPLKRTTAENPFADVLWWPELVHRDEGFCLTFRRETFEGAADSQRFEEAEDRMLDLLHDYDPCPGVQRPPASPRAIAREVVEEFLPPPPRPEIDPGYAITGKPAYLETNGNLTPTPERRPTPLGDIDVTFTGTYRIDWGDGTPIETHPTEGAPWPAGTIAHTYTNTGTYDVVVSIAWTATWRIADTTGIITDNLTSTAIIDNFDVRQLQAVRDR
ncbi:MAG TPA: hypothetical protein VF230_13440 [Acidimicrobiales bacterium]